LDFCDGVELNNCLSKAFWFSGLSGAPSGAVEANSWAEDLTGVWPERAVERREGAEPEPSEELTVIMGLSELAVASAF